ncbi:hypothetical protein [Paenibacillus dendritiformis]|uniref:hypothetical protein n=1 Tax=Paenibacillus dendritiformis TaxID=130049 RepID=UPI000DA9ED6D|nr:hypothetical protein [Paenibacillus dendritiformis]PZM67559.1 hypothetical protein DOE73_00915 [Paenibacillus dendritiformis]
MMDNYINPEFMNPANITDPQGYSWNVNPPFLELDLPTSREIGAFIDDVMNDYTHAPRGIDRLQNATFHDQELVHELKSLELQGFGAFLIAAGLELSVIQARYWNPLTRDEGEKYTARQPYTCI